VTPDDWQNNTQHNKTTGSSARWGTTSLSIGPSSTGAKATHGASPDNRLHRTDSLACSLAGPLRNSGQPAAQDGLTRRQSHRINLRIFADWLPGHPNAGSRPPTTHRSWSFGFRRTDPARHQHHNNPTPQHYSTPVLSSLPSSPPSPLLRRGVMWGHPQHFRKSPPHNKYSCMQFLAFVTLNIAMMAIALVISFSWLMFKSRPGQRMSSVMYLVCVYIFVREVLVGWKMSEKFFLQTSQDQILSTPSIYTHI